MPKITKPKEPVKLRFRALANGNTSLYLDIYHKGQRRYEFLHLYLIPENGPADRARNAETLRLANTVKAQRIVEVQTAAHGLSNRGAGGKMLLSDFMRSEVERYRDKGSARHAQSVEIVAIHAERYAGPHIRLEDVDRAFVEGFIVYLRRYRRASGLALRESTQCSYLTLFASLLNRAVRQGYIDRNPIQQVERADRPQKKCRTRDFLTIEEVQHLQNTPCRREDVKRAFLFCCFSGLRLSDVAALKWGNIRTLSDGTRQIAIVQEKTDEEAFIPLSANAEAFLPSEGDPCACVFDLPGNRQTIGYAINHWAVAAGIKKRVSFHTSRHTYATLLLTYGADLYTVSKLLGHTNVKTTQIYAKIVDEKKRQAVDLIPKI